MAYQSKLNYIAKYKKKFVKKVSIEFNMNNEEDIKLYNYLQEKDNKQKYIKELISQNKKAR